VSFRFVIHEHHAEKAGWHHDFRLKRSGVLKSWAVPKGVPEVSGIQRLAIQVDDHMLSYANFEGTITDGYGKGQVSIWDDGAYETRTWSKERIEIKLHGKKVHGDYVLVRMTNAGNRWLLSRLPDGTDLVQAVNNEQTRPTHRLWRRLKGFRGVKDTEDYMSPINPIVELARLAEKRRLAVIKYKKPSDTETVTRWVEPYKLVEGVSSLLVRCYQVHPEEKAGWKHFKINYISSVQDGGADYTPRTNITLSTGEIVQPILTPQLTEPRRDYYNLLTKILEDRQITQMEYRIAEEAAQDLALSDLRAVHLAILRDALDNVLLDEIIDQAEADYLANIVQMLAGLGWFPSITDTDQGQNPSA
jgi:DNA ligase D-like protein (predicted 3'-phosphoesterase)